MRLSVVTPSFRSSRWLKLCVASIADQPGNVEHIVQDAGSDDGTLDWLPHDRRVKAFVEKDRGMYDAVNRGLQRAGGDILAFLNCDEQYAPDTAPAVLEFFARHPRVEVVFGDFVVVDDRGEYRFHRKVQVPLKYHTWVSHLPTFTCATFFRRELIHNDGLWFNPAMRDAGDAEWMVRLLKRGTRMAVMRRFTSVFTMTGANMSAGENARRERLELRASAPRWAQKLRTFLILHHRLRRFTGGIYFQKPFAFSLYTLESPQQRVVRKVDRPTFRWRTSDAV